MIIKQNHKLAAKLIVDLITPNRWSDNSEFIFEVYMEAVTRINRVEQWELLQDALTTIKKQIKELENET